MEEITKTTKTVWRCTKALGKALVKGFCEGLDKIEEIQKETERFRKPDILKDDKTADGEILVDAGMVRSIRWMNSEQLKAIFSGKKVTVNRDPKTWNELRWMNSDQLKAIFGRGEIKDD